MQENKKNKVQPEAKVESPYIDPNDELNLDALARESEQKLLQGGWNNLTKAMKEVMPTDDADGKLKAQEQASKVVGFEGEAKKKESGFEELSWDTVKMGQAKWNKTDNLSKTFGKPLHIDKEKIEKEYPELFKALALSTPYERALYYVKGLSRIEKLQLFDELYKQLRYEKADQTSELNSTECILSFLGLLVSKGIVLPIVKILEFLADFIEAQKLPAARADISTYIKPLSNENSTPANS